MQPSPAISNATVAANSHSQPTAVPSAGKLEGRTVTKATASGVVSQPGDAMLVGFCGIPSVIFVTTAAVLSTCLTSLPATYKIGAVAIEAFGGYILYRGMVISKGNT